MIEPAPASKPFATGVLLAILLSALLLPFPLLVFFDLCHIGGGPCLDAIVRELSAYDEEQIISVMLGWNIALAPTLVAFAIIAYWLLRDAITAATLALILLTWLVLLVTKGVIGIVSGPIEPGASEVHLLLPFITLPLDVLTISLLTGWADRIALKLLATLAASIVALLTLYAIGLEAFSQLLPLPLGSEVARWTWIDLVLYLAWLATTLAAPVAIWICDKKGWVLLSRLGRPKDPA